MVLSFQEGGRDLKWPGGESPQNPSSEAEYPRDVWALAAAEWSTWGASAQTAYKQEIRVQGEAMQAGFRESFGGMDLLSLLLAMVSAFEIGSGSAARPNA